jgi:hypothetical protein
MATADESEKKNYGDKEEWGKGIFSFDHTNLLR